MKKLMLVFVKQSTCIVYCQIYIVKLKTFIIIKKVIRDEQVRTSWHLKADTLLSDILHVITGIGAIDFWTCVAFVGSLELDILIKEDSTFMWKYVSKIT